MKAKMFFEAPVNTTRAYELDPPYKGNRYVLVDYAYTPDQGPETMAFACDEDGIVTDWAGLWVHHGKEQVTNDGLIKDMGYEVVE